MACKNGHCGPPKHFRKHWTRPQKPQPKNKPTREDKLSQILYKRINNHTAFDVYIREKIKQL